MNEINVEQPRNPRRWEGLTARHFWAFSKGDYFRVTFDVRLD